MTDVKVLAVGVLLVTSIFFFMICRVTGRVEQLEKEVKASKPVDSDSLSVRTYRKGDGEGESVSPSFNIQRLGEYKLTAYCSCPICTGSGKGITATGKQVRIGYIAVDPKVISLHSTVSIEGLGEYVAEDTGGAIKGKCIDIYFNTHQEALNFGVQYRNVYLIKEN